MQNGEKKFLTSKSDLDLGPRDLDLECDTTSHDGHNSYQVISKSIKELQIYGAEMWCKMGRGDF